MMQFGAHLPTYWDDYGTSHVRLTVEEAAKAAGPLGYDSVWANDLVVVPASKVTGANVIEPLITLASLVHLGSRIQLGTSVLVLPQRNAILVANQVAALDLLSESRLLFGVGIGHRAAEFEFLDADFAHHAAVTNEALEVLQTLWRDPVAHYHCRFHRFGEASMLPKPAHGGPPIWIGGTSPGALRRVARYGSAWLPYMIGLDDFQSGVASLRDLTSGRRCPMIAKEFNIRLKKPGEPAAVQTKYPQAPLSVAGSPDAIAQHLDQYRQAGLEYAVCAFESEGVDDLLRQMRVFTEQVVPQLGEAV